MMHFDQTISVSSLDFICDNSQVIFADHVNRDCFDNVAVYVINNA